MLLGELVEAGLEGIEVYYSEHPPALQEKYLAWARELDLVAVGGSDYHGWADPPIRLGRGFGPLHVPDEAAHELRARHDARG